MKPKHIKTGGEQELVIVTKTEFERLKAYERSEKARLVVEREDADDALGGGVHPLRYARQKHRMTQKTLSEACAGLPSQATISRIEKWKATASREVADSIERVLDIGIDLTRIDHD